MSRSRLLTLCALAMTGFAANSLLARGAIGAAAIDPASYSIIRLASGAAMLAVLARATSVAVLGGSWLGASALAAYAAAFSFAYVRIGAALGALIIFPVVHLSLLATGAFTASGIVGPSGSGPASRSPAWWRSPRRARSRATPSASC